MRVKFVTFGCSHNQADTELMRGYVKSAGHELVDDNPDVTVINTCFVKSSTENKVIRLLNKIKGKVVVAGCLAQAMPSLIEAYPLYSFIGVNALGRINEVLAEPVVDITDRAVNHCSARVRSNSMISIIPISQGCLGNCSYCCTKQARGQLRSRTHDSILKQFKQDFNDGAREFWLTGQDIGCYGFDIKTNLPELLNELINVKGDFRIRLGMINPRHALVIAPGLKDCFNSDKLYKFLHLPVQSGSDKVLKDMNRGYIVSDFLKLVKGFDVNIATDVICGYPAETDSDWADTVRLIKKTRPGVLNISRFQPRPGTKAAFLKQQLRLAKERSREITSLYERISIEDNHNMIGQEFSVLSTINGQGRDQYYRFVDINAPIGRLIKARVVSAGVHYLKGQII